MKTDSAGRTKSQSKEDSGKPGHAADRLLAAIDRTAAPVCVGIDPVVGRLPRAMSPAERSAESIVGAMRAFCEGVLQAVAPLVPCVKFQSACFERYGSRGVAALESLVAAARALGLITILDAKRGDIGISAEHYAAAAFNEKGGLQADWVTVGSYLGEDSIRPFLKTGRGAFALVRTSNPGGEFVQSARLESGATVAEHVALMIAEIGEESIGARGYSALGAVVAATAPDDARRLRRIMPRQYFLVPGFGAQGAGVDEITPCFQPDGTGAIVAASRSVICAFEEKDPDWQQAVADAAAEFAHTVGKAVGAR